MKRAHPGARSIRLVSILSPTPSAIEVVVMVVPVVMMPVVMVVVIRPEEPVVVMVVLRHLDLGVAIRGRLLGHHGVAGLEKPRGIGDRLQQVVIGVYGHD